MAQRLMVGGKEVVEVFDIPSDTAPTGKPRHFPHFEGLRLADGSELYRCTEDQCDYIGENKNGLAGHRKKHALTASSRVRDLRVGQLLDAFIQVTENPGASSADEHIVELQKQHAREVADLKRQLQEAKKEIRNYKKQWRNLESLVTRRPASSPASKESSTAPAESTESRDAAPESAPQEPESPKPTPTPKPPVRSNRPVRPVREPEEG